MVSEATATLLAIGLTGWRPQTGLLDVYFASTTREAVATLRLIRIDLLLVGLDDPALDVWEMLRRVLTAWPHQRWLLARRECTAAEEVAARSLGALMVLHDVPKEDWLADFAASLRRRDLSRSVGTLVSADAVASLNDNVATPVETS